MSTSDLWHDLPLAVVDVETTGLNPETDRVIEIAIVHMRGGVIESTYEKLVDPEQELPEEVTKITGIKPEQLVGAPKFAEIAAEVAEHLKGRAFVAYNLAFDRAFVRNELERADLPWVDVPYIDPLIFARELHKKQGSKRLGSVAERLGIVLEDWHRAAADAEAAGYILYKFADQLPPRLDDLLMLQAQWETQQANEMAGWRRNRGGGSAINTSVSGDQRTDRGNSLGPAFRYGEETDPVRAMFLHLPDSGSRR